MTEENQEQLSVWLEEMYDHQKNKQDFEAKEGKIAEARQVCAVMFLYGKLKPENKKDNYFFHGEHDILLIGNDFSLFDDFTKEDAEEATIYGISMDEEYESFTIYASM